MGVDFFFYTDILCVFYYEVNTCITLNLEIPVVFWAADRSRLFLNLVSEKKRVSIKVNVLKAAQKRRAFWISWDK